MTNLLEALEDWTRILESNEGLEIIFCDYRKVFDSVPHRRLLKKLSAYGIRGRMLMWTEDFLTERRQRVVVQGQASSLEDVTSGVPQGSVLGPIFFILYINELPELVQSSIKMFADIRSCTRGLAPSPIQRFCSQMWMCFASGLSNGSSSSINKNAK